MVQSLYNTQINKKRAIGFCHRHHCHVTSTQLKQKECLKKECYHLEKYEHEFWKQRELRKIKKKAKR